MFTATDLSTFSSFSIKCRQESFEELRTECSSLEEPSYFSKKHWSIAVMDGAIPDQMLYGWLDTSYDLVVLTSPRELQQELREMAD